MMDYEFRVIVEKVSVASQQIVKRDTVKSYDLQPPKTILDLGLRHEEQISLLAKVQNALFAEQSTLIAPGDDACPKCGRKISKNGYQQSNFYAVFSDHNLRLQKHLCKNPDCNWQSTPTTKSVFGTDIHPDLAKLQCEQGALHSYREAATNLEKLNAQRRSINNHDRVKMMTNRLGAQLAQENLKPLSNEALPAPAQALVVQVDGGHIPTKDKDKRSFEALAGVIYRPSCIEFVDKHHHRITDKSCVISAMNDELKTIKTYVHNAAVKQGMCDQTHVTALSDGAGNCWSVIFNLKPYCKTLEPILDWFHIGMKFKTVTNALGEAFEASLRTAKAALWQGKAEDTLSQLAFMRNNITDKKKRSRLKGLHDYLQNNQDYLVNYDERKKANQVFTSQIAESHIDSMINARHKRKQKMQWSREGAHNVLQIRALMTSQKWDEQWLDLVLPTLDRAA